MFCVNDVVVYGTTGVCRIIDIRREKFSGEEKEYYVLQPVESDGSTVFCPVGSDKVNIRKPMTCDQIRTLIAELPDTGADWIENEQMRRETYHALIRRGDHQELAGLIKTLYNKRKEKQQTGKKFHAVDEKTMKQAEQLLHGEIAYVMNLQPEEVAPFIAGELETADGSAS